MKYQLSLVSGPAEETITTTAAKDYLRIDGSLEDARILTMIKAATLKLEAYLSIKFVSQVWDIYLDRFPMNGQSEWWDGVREISVREIVSHANIITLPLGKVLSWDQFNTYPDDGVAIPEVTSNYVFDAKGNRARVGLKLGGIWPVTILRPINGVQFRFTLGFGNAAAVPDDIKMALLEFVAHMYENRGDQNEMKIPPHILTLVDHYRRYKLGC